MSEPSFLTLAEVLEIHEDQIHRIAENHPFVDGNKRSGLAAALVFLDLNGIVIEDSKGRLYPAMVKVAKKAMGKESLARVFEDLARPG